MFFTSSRALKWANRVGNEKIAVRWLRSGARHVSWKAAGEPLEPEGKKRSAVQYLKRLCGKR